MNGENENEVVLNSSAKPYIVFSQKESNLPNAVISVAYMDVKFRDMTKIFTN